MSVLEHFNLEEAARNACESSLTRRRVENTMRWELYQARNELQKAQAENQRAQAEKLELMSKMDKLEERLQKNEEILPGLLKANDLELPD